MTEQVALFALAFTIVGAAAAHAGGTGWSCRTCGFSNGTSFTGVVAETTAQPGRNTATAVILPSGDIVDLR